MTMRLRRKRKAERVTRHETPWCPPVVAFYKGSTIRETYAQWWSPHYDSDLSDFLFALCPRSSRFNSVPEGYDDAFQHGGGEPMKSAWKVKVGRTVKLSLVLTYPLHTRHERSVTVTTKRFGEVFGAAHDFYADIYRRDNKAWLRQHGKKVAPRAAANLLNRASGLLVWGHDMSDLVFESLHFEFGPEARAALDKYKNQNQKRSAKLDFDIRRRSIGTVTFGIGS